MVDRKDMRKTQDMIAVTSEQADRIKAIQKRWNHEAATDTVELLLNMYDNAGTKEDIPDDPNRPA